MYTLLTFSLAGAKDLWKCRWDNIHSISQLRRFPTSNQAPLVLPPVALHDASQVVKVACDDLWQPVVPHQDRQRLLLSAWLLVTQGDHLVRRHRWWSCPMPWTHGGVGGQQAGQLAGSGS